ncbi:MULTISPECIES: helix-hairpin-helix domain-containing protein [Pandoraea]|uniref:ComEA family DNA-binding protein n=1 Tax=Pandoraea TaxID=93217 RepID=UPI001F5DF40B|nr:MULTISPECIES: helix-hairpin-helix domain-containing protein [Pandoraea]MCI3208556.1 hypothetical protein [Pandoraea sp. LA3]MDN4586585.1 hypothetical protein [Pandoraea capi]
MAITHRGRLWEWRKSLYLFWLLMPFGNWVPFALAARICRNRRWATYATLYFMANLVVFAAVFFYGGKSKTEAPVLYLVYGWLVMLWSFVLWPFSVVHAFRQRSQVLMHRAEAEYEGRENDTYADALVRQQAREEFAGLKRNGMQANSLKTKSMPEYAVSTRSPKQKHQVTDEVQRVFSPAAQAMPVTAPVRGGKRLDVNAAIQAEFEAHSLIGPILTRKILSYRESGGTFRSVEHFCEVLNIPPHLVAKLQESLYVRPAQGPAITTRQRVVDY